MLRMRRGFTLIELLVVIAIISILAAIVVPNVMKYMRKARVAKATTEIRNIQLALTKVLSDAGRTSVMQLFSAVPAAVSVNFSQATLQNIASAQTDYSVMLYELLRQGRDFSDPNGFELTQDVKTKLGTQYMDLPKDPFGSNYQFWPGPWDKSQGIIPFRSWRANLDTKDYPDPSASNYQPYVYDANTKILEDQDLPGNPDESGLAGYPGYGYPAPYDETAYIWSNGEDLKTEQLLVNQANIDNEHKGGGDDINSWDKKSGWDRFYN